MRPFFCLLLLLVTPLSAQASVRQEVIEGPLKATVVDVLDGDTALVRVHTWIGETIETHVRFAGIDAPEIKGQCERERALAQAARREVAALLKDSKMQISQIRLEKYAGRVLATATTSDGVDIRQHLIAKGLARAYGGERRKSWCN